jgi:hypothetical protein
LIATKTAEDPDLKMSVSVTRAWKNPRKLAGFSHGFESDNPRWSWADSKADTTTTAGGTFSDHPGEFSSTFRVPADSLGLPGFDHLLVSCRLQFLTTKETTASLVVSLDNNQGDDLWESMPLFPMVRSFGTWSPVSFHTVVDINRIRPGSRFSIYIWNNSRDEIYDDDWEITFSAL